LGSAVVAAVPSLDWGQVLLRLVVAGALGAAIGLERELREQDAGLRTHLLVSVGSALFTIVSAYGFHSFLTSGGAIVRTDPTRIAAQIVTGIGFLGAGAIIRQGLNVRGLTTAATLWLVAGVGMASGAGFYSAAVLGTAVALLTLGPLRFLAYRIIRRVRVERGMLLVQLAPGTSPGPLIDEVERLGGAIESLTIRHADERRQLRIEVELPPQAKPPAYVQALADLDDVLEVQWTD
jgi:putative Mg2+ transporter-C (MgtC) family protein